MIVVEVILLVIYHVYLEQLVQQFPDIPAGVWSRPSRAVPSPSKSESSAMPGASLLGGMGQVSDRGCLK